MKVKMLKDAVASDGTALKKGQIVDVGLADDKRLIDERLAERVK